jgi:hypothetical protein
MTDKIEADERIKSHLKYMIEASISNAMSMLQK